MRAQKKARSTAGSRVPASPVDGGEPPFDLPSLPEADRDTFLQAFLAATNDEGVESTETRRLAALDQLSWGARRRAGKPLVRVFNPTEDRNGWQSSLTIVETVTDDRPFLVDSVTMQISALGHDVLSNSHPILLINRDDDGSITGVARAGNGKTDGRAESWMRISIPRIVDRGAIRQLRDELLSTLADVKVAVQDWPAMLDKLSEVRHAVAESRARGIKDEIVEFLDWLGDNRFTFIGYCEYRCDDGESVAISNTGLGLLRAERGLQDFARTGARPRTKVAINVTKAPFRSTIHRPAPLDAISISVAGDDGQRREYRFIGLFTSLAYTEAPGDIPLLSTKTARIMANSGLDPVSHQGKALRHILDTLPRDELMQADSKDLEATALAVLALEDRRRVRVFCRLDTHRNYYSCLVYLPRSQFGERTRTRIEAVLAEHLGGEVVHSQPSVGESALARIAIVVAISPDAADEPDLEKLNAALTEAATIWPERVRAALLGATDEETALRLHARWTDALPLAYQEAVSPRRAVRDIERLDALYAVESREMSTALERAADGTLRFTVLRRERPLELHLANPILENMGLRLHAEHNYHLSKDAGDVWIQDFVFAGNDDVDPAANDLAARFEACFEATLNGRVENDGFNSLILDAGLDWQQANLLRAYCKYVLQTRIRFSQAYMLETLRRYPAFSSALIGYFNASFDPDLDESTRARLANECQGTIRGELDRAVSLDDDRILRTFSTVAQATLRTNYFQTADGARKPYVSFKLDPGRIPELPRPRPKFEIFVYSRRVEGVHLRGGSIARGGLRWSDRREDFRTEVLGLMKAQQVKNTVIVPSGAKGGFVCKQLPDGDRTAVMDEVTNCYRTFLRGLLDITDNIVDENIVTPDGIVCRDDPDPYLVVAADKGTASFSDIANGISAEYDFWLGDAFASGGSAGYDHKKMGITARGAWESVKRHFRELGLDTQRENFSVVGIGDMGGDVFGNGMLLSKHIRLIAAFNHRHIFIDPDPDPAASFAERSRLFELPQSTWEDYASDCISAGGGVYRRDAKTIQLSAEARAALGIDADSLAPPDLIRAILQAPVDLLWNGGIGTYVKSSEESDSDAGDPLNDAVRVSGSELRCRVIGEGGNLGLTQLGRVEFARGGGLVNTDFIDNSAGVDSSDREVNIKILLRDAMKREMLTLAERNRLLARMTDDVAEHVLASNYAQTQALSMLTEHAAERVGEHGRLIRMLESKGLLDRALEFLPSDDRIDERRREGTGLTRPELAIVLSYAKIDLFESLVASDIAEDPHCRAELVAYFPKQIQTNFGELIPSHRLAGEITAMLIASSMINRMGPFFVLRTQEETGTEAGQVARAYATVRALFGTRQLWLDLEALDGQIQSHVQYNCFYEASRMVRRAVYWLLHRHQKRLDISGMVKAVGPPVQELLAAFPDVLCGFARRRFENDAREYEGLGLPLQTARKIATLRLMTQILDIVELAEQFPTDATTIARLYFEIGRGLRLDWIREQIEDLKSQGHWRAMARGTLRETLGREQQQLTRNLLQSAGTDTPGQALGEWMAECNPQITRMRRMFEEMQASGPLDFATLSIALREVSRLT